MESDANGIFVDNSTGLNAGVTILNNGDSRWNSNNSGTDVVILSSGAVALTKVDMTDSGLGGLYVDNTIIHYRTRRHPDQHQFQQKRSDRGRNLHQGRGNREIL